MAAAAVDVIFGPLAAEPHRVGKPLRFELAGLWSARRGQCRVFSSIQSREVLVEVIRCRS